MVYWSTLLFRDRELGARFPQPSSLVQCQLPQSEGKLSPRKTWIIFKSCGFLLAKNQVPDCNRLHRYNLVFSYEKGRLAALACLIVSRSARSTQDWTGSSNLCASTAVSTRRIKLRLAFRRDNKMLYFLDVFWRDLGLVIFIRFFCVIIDFSPNRSFLSVGAFVLVTFPISDLSVDAHIYR
jgi:hypothetical protein